jgi:DNA-binding LacI/PurR family transcriptional regulator
VTIKDVAKAANVSASTVSRVISDSSRISESTKQRVREIMEELGYYPNEIARSLTSKVTSTIGILVPYSLDDVFENPFFPELLRGIGHIAQEYGYHLLMSTGNKEDNEDEYIKKFVSEKRVDGIVLLTSKKKDITIETLQGLSFPFVVIGRPMGYNNISWVDNDNFEAAKTITNFIINNGSRRVAMISGPSELAVSSDRLEGYKAALKENNIALDKKYIVNGHFTEKGGYNAALKLLSLEFPPTAIVAADDIMALGAMKAIRERKLKIPQDIEITGFNNIPVSNYCVPPLTTMDINPYLLGCKAIRMLFNRLKDDNFIGQAIVKTNIIERNSTRRID